jgi:hypothetical protein
MRNIVQLKFAVAAVALTALATVAGTTGAFAQAGGMGGMQWSDSNLVASGAITDIKVAYGFYVGGAGGGGAPFVSPAPAGMVLRGFQGRAANELDYIQPIWGRTPEINRS